jgi:hypothetical protein
MSRAQIKEPNEMIMERKIAGGNAMKSKMLPVLAFAVLLGCFFFAASCGNGVGNQNCPVCGTNQNGGVNLIDVMIVPEHNPNGEPGGPFNIFDISWVDPTNRLFFVADRIGLDVPMFSTVTNIAIFAIGGQNSVTEGGNNTSVCDPTIPPTTTAQGNFTRFGCKNPPFRLPGGFGPNGNFGGWMGAQCCASRANSLNPLAGPNGLEVSADGRFLFVGSGSSSMAIFDLQHTLQNNSVAPTVIANIPTGTSPDYDGIPDGITGCMQSANGRAFSDPTCGDLRGDELVTTGGIVTFPQDGSSRFLVMIINGDPGLPFATVIDATGVINGALNGSGTPQQQHCLPVNFALPPNTLIPYSPGGPNTTFAQNFPSCILGQIYYDGVNANETNVVVDDGNNGPEDPNAGFACPDPSLQFNGTPGNPGAAVPSGVSGRGAGVEGADVPCHHAAVMPAPFGLTEVGVAGLGGMAFNTNNGHFLLTNSNASTDITLGTVDDIDPLSPTGPIVANAFLIKNCMPTGIVMGPGTDALVGCADHDGRAFAPSSVIINSVTGEILTTINNVGAVDQVWYNPGDNRYYLAARDMPTGPVLGVIDAGTRQWLQNVPTNGNAHSVAADPKNNHIFVPLPSGSTNCQSAQQDGCVGVYARD